MTRRSRGKVAIALGFLFPVMLLIGGGYVTATNAAYWCSVFGVAYVVGLVCPGVLVYRSAAKMPEPTILKSLTRWQYAFIWFAVFVGLLISSAFDLTFFKSDFLATAQGKHIFTILQAVFMSQFIPLGLGWYFSDAEDMTVTPTN